MKRFRQIGIRTLLVATMLFASFAAGYRKKNENPRGLADFDELMRLIESTVVPSEWEALGGPSTMAPYPQNLSLKIVSGVVVHGNDDEWPDVDLSEVDE